MELIDTIEMMNSEDFRERFKAEYFQLKIRYEKLKSMVEKARAGILPFKPVTPIEVLEEQTVIMREYLNLLVYRADRENINLEE